MAWTAYALARAPGQARFAFGDPRALERAQRRRLRAIVGHAHRHVPYYRETMRKLGLEPGDLLRAADLARLPFIERSQLLADPEYFVSCARPLDSYLRLRGGGSSGAPVTVFVDPFALFRGAAYERRWKAIRESAAGTGRRTRRMYVSPPTGVGLETTRAFWQLVPTPGPVRRRLRPRGRPLSMVDPLDTAVEVVNERRPDILESYGSYIEALFVHAQKNGARLDAPGVVAYGSDALAPAVRELIVQEFGARVLSHYGATEAFNIGFECERNAGYHLNLDICPVRIVGPNAREVPHGESGEVVVSNLVNRATVLLNYRLGDVASRLLEPCPCGRSLPLISFIEGRTDEWITSPAGERLHPQVVKSALKDHRAVLRFQIAQRSSTHFDVAVVPSEPCDRAALARAIRTRFAELLGADVTTAVSFVASLPRTAGGKTRAIVPLAGGV